VKLVVVNAPERVMKHDGAAANRIGVVGDCRMLHVPGLTPSAVLNPCPLIVTPVPLGPKVGLRVMIGTLVVTVKAAVAKSPVEPVTVTTYNPGAAVAETVKPLRVNCPPVRVHVNPALTIFVGVLITDVHVAESPALKPLPVIVTPVATGPAFGERLRDGTLVTTMNVAVARSPVPPVTVTVVVVGATLPTLKLVSFRVPVDVIVQVLVPIRRASGLVIVQAPTSFTENPEPVIVTLVP
jgi:hypothetical protein